MAHVWIRDTQKTWIVQQLDSGAWALTTQGGRGLTLKRTTSDLIVTPTFLSSRGDGTEEIWILLASLQSNLRLNGERMHLGVHALRHSEWHFCLFGSGRRVATLDGRNRRNRDRDDAPPTRGTGTRARDMCPSLQ